MAFLSANISADAPLGGEKLWVKSTVGQCQVKSPNYSVQRRWLQIVGWRWASHLKCGFIPAKCTSHVFVTHAYVYLIGNIFLNIAWRIGNKNVVVKHLCRVCFLGNTLCGSVTAVVVAN